MKSPSFRNVIVAVAAIAFGILAPFSAQADLPATYTDPAQVKELIQQAMQLPQSQNDTKVFYACCMSHLDDLIPYFPSLYETPDTGRMYNKYTFHDGRISTVETIDPSGNTADCIAIWNNSAGAPVLVAYRLGQDTNADYDQYAYAEYDSSGKVHGIYHYDKSFNLSFTLKYYAVFSYQDNVTTIQEYGRDSRLIKETIYDNGKVYAVENGEKQLLNIFDDRTRDICSLVKYGLKPFYPNY